MLALAGRAAVFFAFFACGVVLSFESRESSFIESISTSEFSSSESGFARFFGFGAGLVTFAAVCFGAAFALGAAAFFAGALAGALAF